MSVLYLYALAAGGLDEPPLGHFGHGITGEPLERVPCGGLSVIVGRMVAAPRPGPETLAAQDALIGRLAQRFDALLPVRFGEVALDEADLTASLAPRSASLAAALEQVRGCAQMTLRLLGEPGPSNPTEPAATDDPGPGTRYLEARRREAERARALPELEPLRDAVRPFLQAERIERRPAPGLLGSAYHLVRREDLPAYLTAMREAEGRLGGRRIIATGPWPAYAFAPGLQEEP